MATDSISILISGDLVPTKANEQLFSSGDSASLVGPDILSLFTHSDISTINLECALTTANTPIFKCGPNLKASPNCIKGIKAFNPSLIGLANNHIMDFGENGLQETLDILDREHLAYLGVGNNLEEAFSSFRVIEEKGFKVGFYACAEHEFTLATEQHPGANPFDPLCTGDYLSRKKKELALDALIVLYLGYL